MEPIDELDLMILAKCILFGEIDIPSFVDYISLDSKKLLECSKTSNQLDIDSYTREFSENFEYIKDLKKTYPLLKVEYYHSAGSDYDDLIKTLLKHKDYKYYTFVEKEASEVQDIYGNSFAKTYENALDNENAESALSTLILFMNEILGVKLSLASYKKRKAEKEYLTPYLEAFYDNNLYDCYNFRSCLKYFLDYIKLYDTNNPQNFVFNLSNYIYYDSSLNKLNITDTLLNLKRYRILETIIFLEKEKCLEIEDLEILKKYHFYAGTYDDFIEIQNSQFVKSPRMLTLEEFTNIQERALINDAIGWSCTLSFKKTVEDIENHFIQDINIIKEQDINLVKRPIYLTFKDNQIILLSGQEFTISNYEYNLLFALARRPKERINHKSLPKDELGTPANSDFIRQKVCRLNKKVHTILVYNENGYCKLTDNVRIRFYST